MKSGYRHHAFMAMPIRCGANVVAMTRSPSIWTIGHSNHEFEEFVELLQGQEIDVVVDVRSFPYSRFAPQFNQDELRQELQVAGFRYLFLGEQLGGRPARPDHYDAEGRALYGPMAEESGFQDAIDRLISGAADHRIALLCSEGKPEGCHRRLLVGKVLAERGIPLHHILPDGKVEEEREVRLAPDGDQAALFANEAPPEIYTIGFTQTTAEHFYGPALQRGHAGALPSQARLRVSLRTLARS